MFRRYATALCASGIFAAIGASTASLKSQSVTAQEAGRSFGIAAADSTLPSALGRIDNMLRVGELDIASTEPDTMIAGRAHERLQQMHLGVPVFGGYAVRQLDGRSIVSLSGRLFEGIEIAATPALEAASAIERALRETGLPAEVDGDAVLGVLPVAGGRYVLAYRFRTRSLLDLRVYYVNANTGAIEREFSNIQSQAIVGRGTGVLGDAKKMSAFQSAGAFQTDDRLRPARTLTFDFRGQQARLESFNGLFFNSDFASTSNNVWVDGAVVDAHVYQGWTYDYYFKRFGRRGLNNGDSQIIGIVHPLARADTLRYSPDMRDKFINNASYYPDFDLVLYGDGDGRTFNYLAGALDVVSHELTHGVTSYSSNLEYVDESGALNEAFSDIMAASVEFFYQPAGNGPRLAEWRIGEDVVLGFPGFLRSLDDPASGGGPDHYSLRQFIGSSVDNGGVHFNSTIPSHAFYLAVAGGRNRQSGMTVAGVGLRNIERMERIFYRAFTGLGSSARFSDARAGTLQAATDLFGADSNERVQVEQAWTAVGVN